MTGADLPDPDRTVTLWVARLRAGDSAAVCALWDGYFARLVAVARRRLGPVPRAAADGEDIALAALADFCRGLADGRFPRLISHEELWRVLFTLATRQVNREVRSERALKRGGGAASALGDRSAALAGVAGREPTPARAAESADACDRLLAVLGDEFLRRLAVWKWHGATNAEIAVMAGRSVPTVERKLARIRAAWRRELDAPPD